MNRLFKGIVGINDQHHTEGGELKEVAFNSRTKKTLIRDGDHFMVISGTNKAFIDTLRKIKYMKFDSLEAALEFFKENGDTDNKNES